MIERGFLNDHSACSMNIITTTNVILCIVMVLMCNKVKCAAGVINPELQYIRNYAPLVT